MGYTHYFTQKQSVDPLMWQNFREHLDKLYHHYLANPISAEQICGGYPDKPIVLCDGLEEKRLNDGSLFTDDGEALCFNGNAADDIFRSLLTGISGTGSRCWTVSVRYFLILS